MPATVIYGDKATQVGSASAQGDNLWLSLDDLDGRSDQVAGSCHDVTDVPAEIPLGLIAIRHWGGWDRYQRRPWCLMPAALCCEGPFCSCSPQRLVSAYRLWLVSMCRHHPGSIVCKPRS